MLFDVLQREIHYDWGIYRKYLLFFGGSWSIFFVIYWLSTSPFLRNPKIGMLTIGVIHRLRPSNFGHWSYPEAPFWCVKADFLIERMVGTQHFVSLVNFWYLGSLGVLSRTPRSMVLDRLDEAVRTLVQSWRCHSVLVEKNIGTTKATGARGDFYRFLSSFWSGFLNMLKKLELTHRIWWIWNLQYRPIISS